jgi:hypothetical protein
MRHLALFLSIVALALSSATIVLMRRATQVPIVEAPHPAHRPAPASQPLSGSCSEVDGVTTLLGVMKKGVNVQLTRVSFALYHDKRDADARMESVATAAAALRTCVSRATVLAPELPHGELGEYFRMLNGLEEDALAVQIAALEKDQDSARHWYMHMKQDCASCHNRFRVEDEEK